ncbi:MAG: NAD(P)(+) transhydrogenase (Re/Si-specific) subunit beta [Actinomycetota bacterium]|nr:NAD(P)(+) transhydrogenase (Re/Si-specific) subunit beta [Actinomycetota bacterium]
MKGLTRPLSARVGNLIGAAGMVVALGFTLGTGMHHLVLLVVAIVLGAAIGVPAARKVKMTAMPQMVALFNGVGGGAAALVALDDFANHSGHAHLGTVFAMVFDVVIGAISFSGSAVAFAKLQELLPGKPIVYPAQQAVNGAIGIAILALSIASLAGAGGVGLSGALVLSLILGVAFVLPIGGADAPVVISLLNSFTGLAVAASGFVLGNTVLIVGGTLVGASGTLLTRMMSQAMGRSLANVLFGAFGSVTAAGGGAGGGGEARPVRQGTADDIGTMLAYARQVVIVPGYGLAVAQAQHTARDLAAALEARGVRVAFAIHPVAGRMPGHMNVLLAEADVPYEQLEEMDQANPQLASTDVALVVGANDVVNPAARDSPGSPIYGMPILEVDQAKAVVFLKRSMRPGFAGIDNELLYNDKTTLLFGDAKESLSKLVAAVKAA